MPTYRNGQLGELVEPVVLWNPGLAGGTDLEAGSTVISATSEPGAADYSSTHNVVAPTDARIVVGSGAMRLSITGNFGGGGVTLNYKVKRNGATVKTGTFTADGAHLVSWDITANITGSQVNTVFLWVDAGTFTVTELTIWSAVGISGATATGGPFITITQPANSRVQILGYLNRVGTGTWSLRVAGVSGGASSVPNIASPAAAATINLNSLAPYWLGEPSMPFYMVSHTVATDISYVNALELYFRSAG